MQFRLAILTLLILCCSPLSVFAVETKDIKFPIKDAAPVTFSHEFHLKKYSNNCKVCHNAIFNLKERRHYTMADMEKTKSCGACHSGVKAFSVADSKSCTICHKGIPKQVEYKVKTGNVTFNHSFHVAKLNSDCKACHNSKVITGRDGHVTMAEMEKGKTCGACHNDKRAFTVQGNCGRCHKGMKTHDIVFKPKGITEVVFSHDYHTARFKCKECHTKVFPFKADGGKPFTMAEMAKGKACGACHNGKQAFLANSDCNRCHKGFQPGVVLFKTEIGNAKFSHQVHLGMFKCQDCHTKIFPYSTAGKRYSMHDMEKGESCGSCHDGKEAFTVSGNCENCHQ